MRNSLFNFKPTQTDKGEKCDMTLNIASVISLERK